MLDGDQSFSDKDKNIFKDIFQNKEKTRDIALKYNVDTKTITSIKHRILTKFKNALMSEYHVNSFYDVYSA